MTGHPLRPVTRRRLGRPLPYQLPDGTQTAPSAPFGLYSPESMSVYPQFPMAIQLRGARSYVFLTRPPLCSFPPKLQTAPLDLHVLGTPPAFTLSQDQTLQAILFRFNPSFVSSFSGGCYSYFNDRPQPSVSIFTTLSTFCQDPFFLRSQPHLLFYYSSSFLLSGSFFRLFLTSKSHSTTPFVNCKPLFSNAFYSFPVTVLPLLPILRASLK